MSLLKFVINILTVLKGYAVQYSLVTTMLVTMIYVVITMPGKYPGLRALL
jgi:hypothetical protein